MFLTQPVLTKDLFDLMMDDFFFNSPVKDMNPYKVYRKDKQYIIEVKTLGIAESDINVRLNNDILVISGETKNDYDSGVFNTKLNIKLGEKIVSEIEKIDYQVKNGLTYVFLNMKEPKSSTISISKI